MQKKFPQRKSIRLKGYDYSTPGYYFITICIKNRISLLGVISESKIKLSNEGIIVNRYMSSISEIYHNVQIDEYIIMPNHIHILINIKEQGKFTISNIIQQLKGKITKELGYSIWQKLFYEHTVRNEKEYYLIKQYIIDNVINWEQDRYYI